MHEDGRWRTLTSFPHLTSNLLDFALCLFANTSPGSSKGRLHTSCGSAVRNDLTEPGRDGLSFIRPTPGSRLYVRIRRPLSPTVERWNTGPMDLSRSISKGRSPVPRGDCFSQATWGFWKPA